MQKQLKDFTVTELKALAYDAIANIQKLENDIKIINEEITKRATETQPTPETETKEETPIKKEE